MKIQRGLSLSLAMAAALLSGGCLTPGTNDRQPQSQSPLQIRARETRTYEEHDAKAMLKTAMNVLQDEGYLVDYGDTGLGLLHATKTSYEYVGRSWYWIASITRKTEATVNVSEFGDGVRVRITFQTKLNDSQASIYFADLITEPKFYQDFFAKLDRGLFIQKQGL